MSVLSSLSHNQASPAFSSSPDPTCYDNALVPWEIAGGYTVHHSAAMAALSLAGGVCRGSRGLYG